MKLTKLDRPPYVHNWVRYNHPEELKTTKSLVAFATNIPQITYVAGSSIIRDRIALGLDRETALKAAETRGHERSRKYVVEYVEAFYRYDEIRKYSGLPSFDEYVAPYRLSREVQVPVKPLIVISEKGVLVPLFIVGWAAMPLTVFQRRLLMTVFEDAVFSLTDFQRSPGEFVSFPRSEQSNSGSRTPEIWRRGDYDLLSEQDMKDQTEIYLRALANAKVILSEKVSARNTGTVKERPLANDAQQIKFEI